MKKRLIIISSVIVILILGIGLIVTDPQDNDINSSEPLILANPLDLTQIKLLSKFRSCVGHDYSGRNAKGEKETDRSMKHYITTIQSSGQVNIVYWNHGSPKHISQVVAAAASSRRWAGAAEPLGIL